MKTLLFAIFLLAPSLLPAQQLTSFRDRAYKNALLIERYKSQKGASDSARFSVSGQDSTFKANLKSFVDGELSKFIADPFDKNIDTIKLQVELVKLREFDAIRAFKAGSRTQPFGTGGILSALTPSSAYQSLVIDAVAKLVAEEFQASVSTVYLNRFRERLEQVPGLVALLPQTNDLLQRGNLFRFQAVGQEFRAAFEEDLKQLPAHLNTYLEDTPISALKPPFSTLHNSTIYPAFHFSADAADKLLHGYTPGQLLDYLSVNYRYHADTRYQPFYKSVALINIIQKNLQDEDKIVQAQQPGSFGESKPKFKNIWLDFAQLDALFNTPKAEAVGYFLGLMYQENRDFFDTQLGNPALLNAGTTSASRLLAFRKKVMPALTLLLKMEKLLEKDRLNADDYNLLMQQSLDLLMVVNAISPSKLLSDTTLNIFRKVVDIHKSILRQDYAQVVPNVVFVFDQLPGISTNSEWIRARAILSKYGPFVTGVVAAKTSDDLKDVLKKAVLPNGSYAAKRLSLSSLTLTAHPGFVSGAERLYQKLDGQLSPKGDFQASLGFTAPIGVEFTVGLRRTKKAVATDTLSWERARYVRDKGEVGQLKGRYLGVMLQFADIGAVVNYRLNDPDKELPAQITFKQVFSPGFMLHYGFRNTPLTLGAGVQYTSALRRLDNNGATTDLNAFRIQTRLTWDLPLVNFSTKTEKK